MLSRSTRITFFAMLFAVYVACLGTGLWMQHWLSKIDLEQQVHVATAQQLAPRAERVNRLLLEQPAAADESWAHLYSRLSERLSENNAASSDMLILCDQQGNFVAGATEALPLLEEAWKQKWWESVEFSSDATQRSDGAIEVSGTRFVGWHIPVATRNASAIIFRSTADVGLTLEMVSSTSANYAVAVFVWTGIVVALGIFLLSVWLTERLQQSHSQQEMSSLRQMKTLERTRDAIIFGLAKLAESRDQATGFHLDRISRYASCFANALRFNPKYADIVTPQFVQLIGIGSVLHDIGKVGIEDSILLKPGPLTDSERIRIQDHPVIGCKCLQDIERRLGASNFLVMAREIARWHHERWDGAGYPDGLAGEDISLAARIVAIVDSYDVMSTKRVYKDALPHDVCVSIIREEAGAQFDPELVKVFISVDNQFRQIAKQFANHPPDKSADGRNSPPPSIASQFSDDAENRAEPKPDLEQLRANDQVLV